jgi:hypothetical protein
MPALNPLQFDNPLSMPPAKVNSNPAFINRMRLRESIASDCKVSRPCFCRCFVPFVLLVPLVLHVGCTSRSPSINDAANANADAANRNAARQLLDAAATYLSQPIPQCQIVALPSMVGRWKNTAWAMIFNA